MRLFLFTGDEMKDNIAVIAYNLSFIIKRLEQLAYEAVDYQINEKLKIINEKIYEISDVVEEIEEIASPYPSPKERG